jgi:alkylhydroperoxidase family enzyme
MSRLPFTDPGKNLGVNIFRVMNHAEQGAKGFSSLGSRLLGQTKLDAKLRELVNNAISVELDSPYEWSHHAKWALDVGATADELEAIKRGDHDALGPRERAVVEYALKVEANDVTVADIENLRAVGLDDQAVRARRRTTRSRTPPAHHGRARTSSAWGDSRIKEGDDDDDRGATGRRPRRVPRASTHVPRSERA